MKRVWAALALAVVLVLSWVTPAAAWDNNNNYGGPWGNTGHQDISWGTSFYYQIGEGIINAQLIEPKTGTQVGSLTVWESSGNINIKYDSVAPWIFSETDLRIGRGWDCNSAEDKIPQDKQGNYDLSKFIRHANLSCTTDIFKIAENTLSGSGNWLCIAAYAKVKNVDKIAEAWGDIVCPDQWKLPKGSINENVLGYGALDPGPNINLVDIKLTGVGDGYSIKNNIYLGWCADSVDEINGSATSVKVYSSLNLLGTPTNIAKIKWDMINYILNHYNPAQVFNLPISEGISDKTVTIASIQYAIWYFTNGVLPNSNTGYIDADKVINDQANKLITEAKAHGNCFKPGPGQIGAVILDPGPGLQLLFVELLVPCNDCEEVCYRHDCDQNNSWYQKDRSCNNGSSSCQINWSGHSTIDDNCTKKDFSHKSGWDSNQTAKQILDRCGKNY